MPPLFPRRAPPAPPARRPRRARSVLLGGLCAAGLLAPGPLPAEPAGGNAAALLDAYLSQAAAGTPRFRTDLRPGGDPARVPPGRGFGLGPILGPFTYRPKTYKELSAAERSELWRDPALRAYLARAAAPPAASPPPRAVRRFTLAPEEMLRARPWDLSPPAP